MAAAKAAQAQWLDRSPPGCGGDPGRSRSCCSSRIAGGETAFKTNCAPCHGLGGAGQGFFPTLADDDWLWGGGARPDRVHHPSRHPERRRPGRARQRHAGLRCRRPARPEADRRRDPVRAVADQRPDRRRRRPVAGAAVFAENCASCHGEAGRGLAELGGPALNDAIWLYGGEPAQIAAQINRPRLGVMPPWQGRLDDDDDQDAGGLRAQPGRRPVAGPPPLPRLAPPPLLCHIGTVRRRSAVRFGGPGSPSQEQQR